MNLHKKKASGKEMEVLPLRQGEDETIHIPRNLKTQSKQIPNLE